MLGERPDLAGLAELALILEERPILPGLAELDSLLPRRGLTAGSLVDLHADEGAGALGIALAIAARQERLRSIVLVDAWGDFYPPAAAQAGIDLARLVLIRPAPRDALACVDEALRARAVAATIARLRRLPASSGHRLRVAAESGGGLGLLVRPSEERVEVSAAALRLLVTRLADGSLELTPLRVRGGALPGPLRLARDGKTS